MCGSESPCKLRSRCSARGGRRGTSHPRRFSQWLCPRTPSWLSWKVISVSSWDHLENLRPLRSQALLSNFIFEAFGDIKLNILFLLLLLPESQSDHISPDVGTEDNCQSVENNQEGDQAQERKPEPDENVDFLIHCKNYIVFYQSNYNLKIIMT